MSSTDTYPDVPQANQGMAIALVAPLFAGWIVNIFMCGMYVNAFTTYYRVPRMKRDGKITTGAMWAVMVLQIVYLLINMEEMFHYADVQNRTTNALVSGGFMFSFQPIVAGGIQFLVQVFLTIRASNLFHDKTQKYIFFFVMGVLICAGLAGELLVTSLGFMTYKSETLPLGYGAAVALWLWSTATTDTFLSVALYYNLNSRISGFNENTDSTLRALGNVALRTAAYTSVVAVAGACVSVGLSFTAMFTTNVPCAFYLPLPSLYAFSLFTTISARDSISATHDAYNDSGSGSKANPYTTNNGHTQRGVAMTIHVEEEIAVELSSEPRDGWSEGKMSHAAHV